MRALFKCDFWKGKGGLWPISGALQSTNALMTWHRCRFSCWDLLGKLGRQWVGHQFAMLSPWWGRVLVFPPYYFTWPRPSDSISQIPNTIALRKLHDVAAGKEEVIVIMTSQSTKMTFTSIFILPAGRPTRPANSVRPLLTTTRLLP